MTRVAWTTPDAGPLRRSVERRSAAVLVYLAGRRPLVAAVPLVLLVALFFARGPIALLPGALLLAVVGWLAYLSWPHVAPRQRLLRVAVLAVVVLATVVQLGR